MAVLPVQAVVTSETDPDVTYLVQLPYCPCKDFRYRRAAFLAAGDGSALADLFCKHLRKAVAAVGGWRGRATASEVFEGVSRQRARMLMEDFGLAGSMISHMFEHVTSDDPQTCPAAPGHPQVRLEVTSRGVRLYTVTIY
jgi:hypothetical protein